MSLVARLLTSVRLRLVALCLCAASVLGCATMMGDNFNDDYAQWGEKARPAGPPGDLFGWSTKSQQIERNLGVR